MALLEDRAALKGFWAQYPKARRLFGEIVNIWRSAASRKPGTNGYWAAWPYPWWSERTGIPERTLKRYLNLLEQHGLIERTLGHHSGNRVITFMRPTDHALKLSDGYDKHWDHLHKKHFEPKLEPANQLFKLKSQPVNHEAKTCDDEDKPKSLDEILAILNEP